MDKVENGNIILYINWMLEEVIGDQMGVIGLCFCDMQQSDNIEMLDIVGFFVVIGYSLNMVFFEGQFELENGYIKVQFGIYGNVI